VGDIVNRDVATKFEDEFGEDFITKYRSPLLDRHFGARVVYSLNVDDSNWEAHVVATVLATGDEAEEVFILGQAPSYCLADVDDYRLIEIVMEGLDMDEEEAGRRLVEAGLITAPAGTELVTP